MPPLVPPLPSTRVSEELMWNLFLFCNPWACPVWTARILLEEPPLPPWKATSLTHILTLAPRGVNGLRGVARGADPPENQILFPLMPLGLSGLDFPGLLDLEIISHLAHSALSQTRLVIIYICHDSS